MIYYLGFQSRRVWFAGRWNIYGRGTLVEGDSWNLKHDTPRWDALERGLTALGRGMGVCNSVCVPG